MKKIFILLAAMAAGISAAFAQSDIKRPESFNYQSGIDAFEKQDYAASLDYFEKELQQNPKNGYAMVWEAYIYQNYEKYGQALEKINEGISNLPKKDKEWVGMSYGERGEIYAALGDTVKAMKDYETAFKASNETTYIFDKCNILHEQERYDEESKEIARAMKVNENDATTWTYAARVEYAKGNYDAAIEKYSYSAKLDPKYSSAFSFRADTYIAMGKYREAAQDVVQALSIDNSLRPFYQMFEVADSSYTIMVQQLKAQQLKEPYKAEWPYYAGLVQLNHNCFADAEQSLRAAMKADEYERKSPVNIREHLADALSEQGKYNEALSLLDECEALDSTTVETYSRKSEVLYNMGRSMESIENATKCITLSPENDEYFYIRSRRYMYANLLKNALDDINSAIALDPDDSAYRIQRAEIYRLMGNQAEAVNDCKDVISSETALDADEQNLDVLAYAYIRSGDFTSAAPVIERIMKTSLKSGDEYNLACMYSLMNQKEDALSHLEKAFEKGYCEFVQIKNDYDLDNIRGTEKFKSLVGQYSAKYAEDTAAAPVSSAQYVDVVTEVPFSKESGVCKVKCKINDLPLHFIFDTGAADVTVSSVEAQFMLKNDYLKTADIKGKAYYGDANGDISEGTIIILKKVEFGGLELTNVRASVVHNQKAPLLLGQTVLSRLGRIEIDNGKSVLKITSKKRK